MDTPDQASLELNQEDRAAGEAFARLVAIMRRLRAPGGCPWDREQTIASLAPYLLEETYEVLDAIEREDWAALQEELGDLLLQPVFQAEIAGGEGRFTIVDPLNAIVEKLIRRHPHVFGTVEGDARQCCGTGTIKQGERSRKAAESASENEGSLLDSLPRSMPALAEAQRITSRAAKVGFDWPGIREVLGKLHEEIGELDEARQAGDADKVEDEFGDLLFVMANLSLPESGRGAGVAPHNLKFRQRLHTSSGGCGSGADIQAVTLEEMEALWQEAKQGLR